MKSLCDESRTLRDPTQARAILRLHCVICALGSWFSQPWLPRIANWLYCLLVDEATLDNVRARLSRVEARLSEQDDRLAALERGREEKVAIPPAYMAKEPMLPKPKQGPPPVQVARNPRVYPPVRTAEEAEYQIGARVLPYTGATVVIIGLAYLVSLAIGRGFITPTMLWWGRTFFRWRLSDLDSSSVTRRSSSGRS